MERETEDGASMLCIRCLGTAQTLEQPHLETVPCSPLNLQGIPCISHMCREPGPHFLRSARATQQPASMKAVDPKGVPLAACGKRKQAPRANAGAATGLGRLGIPAKRCRAPAGPNGRLGRAVAPDPEDPGDPEDKDGALAGSWFFIKRSIIMMKPVDSTRFAAKLKTATATAGPCMPSPREMAMTPAPTSPRGHMPKESASLVRRSASFL
mmetsp:Transcript_136013/g.322288  ORF Transcript_136013/g.322288 Transcript_136013/m.322288 type:complete len:211 (+) Transcript_136013:13-645(+)